MVVKDILDIYSDGSFVGNISLFSYSTARKINCRKEDIKYYGDIITREVKCIGAYIIDGKAVLHLTVE